MHQVGHRGYLVAALVVVAGTVFGCAEHKALDKSAATGVTRIVLPPIGQPPSLTAINLGNPGFIFGLVGALAASSVESDHGERFSKAVREGGGIDLGSELADLVARELGKDGYEVVAGAGAAARSKPNGLYAEYAQFQLSATDAVLDIAIRDAGYRGTLVLPYRPFIWATVRLVTPSSGRTLYAEQLAFDADTVLGRSAGRLAGNPDDSRCAFPSSDALNAAAPRAAECLRTGAELMARTIATDLRRE